MHYEWRVVVYHQPIVHHCTANAPVPVRKRMNVFKCCMKVGSRQYWILPTALFEFLQEFFNLLWHIFGKRPNFMNSSYIVMVLELAGAFSIINVTVFIKCAAC